jgi:hypothetical protein
MRIIGSWPILKFLFSRVSKNVENSLSMMPSEVYQRVTCAFPAGYTAAASRTADAFFKFRNLTAVHCL